jgi:hypothetical protein
MKVQKKRGSEFVHLEHALPDVWIAEYFRNQKFSSGDVCVLAILVLGARSLGR